jgi:aspartate 1-decarboxylase
MSYGSLPLEEARNYHPILVFPDDNNHLLK